MAERFPVQCSDDGDSEMRSEGEQRSQRPLVQTGLAVSPYAPPAPPANTSPQQTGSSSSSDLQTDAAREGPPAAHHAGARGDADYMEITDGGRRITMTGVMGAIRPGVNVQIGATTNMTVYQQGRHMKVLGTTRSIPPMQRITDSKAAPTTKQLSMVSDGLAMEWRSLGRALGMEDSTLDQVELDYKSHGQREINYQFLHRWRQQQPRTLHTLAKALADIGRGDLADKLASS